MAKKIALKIWSIILTSISLLTVSEPAKGLVQDVRQNHFSDNNLLILKSEKPKLFLEQTRVGADGLYRFAAHRSHSSHRSHYSHRSSSSGYSEPSTPSYSPSTSGSSNSSGSYATTNSNSGKVNSSSTSSQQSPIVTPSETKTSLTKDVYFNDGSTLKCESAFEALDKVYCIRDGEVHEFSLSKVNKSLTFGN